MTLLTLVATHLNFWLNMKEKNIKISIITLTYNNKSDLNKTLNSILKQKFDDFEIIVVDGGSDYDVVSFLSNKLVGVSYIAISEPDRGIAHAFNKGTKLASGQLITYLNSGDCYIKPNVLNHIWGSYKKNKWAWGFGLRNRIDEIGNVSSPRKCEVSNLTKENYLLGKVFVSHQATFFERNEVLNLGSYNEKYQFHAMDIDLIAKFWSIHEPQIILDELVLYDTTGISSKQFSRTLITKTKILYRYNYGSYKILLILVFLKTMLFGKFSHFIKKWIK